MKNIIKKNNMTDKEKLYLKTLKKVVRATDNKIMLFYGTLLGCIREKAFISWDTDIDVAILAEDFKLEYIDRLKQEGFEIKISKWESPLVISKKDVGKISKLNLNIYEKKRGIKKRTHPHVCFDILMKGKYDYRYYNGPGLISGFLEHFITPLIEKPFYDLTVRVPQNYDAFFNFIYGKNWRTPVNWKILAKRDIKRLRFNHYILVNGKCKNGWKFSKNRKTLYLNREENNK